LATTGSVETTRLALAPQFTNDGLVEVTLRRAAGGSGLAFRYEDSDNWWAVTTTPDRVGWQVLQAVQGELTEAGHFSGPVYDGVTVTVTQNGDTVRFLLDGVEYFRVLAPAPTAPTRPTRAGLAGDGPEASAGQWDRYLVMANSAGVGA
jgi:hypothetical protein